MQIIQKIKHYTKLKRVRWTLVVLWALVIFMMSNMGSVMSWYLTGEVLTVIETGSVDSETSFDDKMSSYNEDHTAYKMYLLRKAAHVTEYLIFAVLLYGAFSLSVEPKKAYMRTLATGFIYAMFDEFHQLFISGRTGSIIDVFIDTGGVLLGMLCMWLYLKWIDKRKGISQSAL